MPTPSPDNLYVGSGEVFFDRFDADGNSTGLRSLGNVDKLEVTFTVNTVEKQTSLSGLRALLKKVVVGTSAQFQIELNEFDQDNLALMLLGKKISQSQAQSTATAAEINGGREVALGVWYPLGGFNPTVTDVKQGATTLVAGTDYIVDTESGLIKFQGAATATATTWDGTIPAIAAFPVVQAMNAGTILGHLVFKGAADQAAGPRLRVDVWRVSITPNGALGFLGDDFGAFTLNGDVLQDATRAAGDQYLSITPLPVPSA